MTSTYVPAPRPPALCELAADRALATGHAIAVVTSPSGDRLSTRRRDLTRPGTLVAVPDVVEAELIANGHGDAPPAPRAVRADGRSVAFYRVPARSAVTR